MPFSKSESPISGSFLGSLSAWALAARPKTLTAAVVPVAVTSSFVAAFGYRLRPGLSFAALGCALLLQVATNLWNDVLDFEKGADNSERLGPPRAAQNGWLSPTALRWMALSCSAAAALLAVPLIAIGGWPVAVLTVLSLLCGYAYTGGPFPLAYLGLGEIFVVLFFGLAAVVGLGYLQLGAWQWPFVLAGAQLGLLAAALLAVNNLRDIDGDTRVGKKTFAVRAGKRAARWEITVLLGLSFAGSTLWFLGGKSGVAWLPWLALPIAIGIIRSIWRTEPSRAYNRILEKTALLHVTFGVLLGLGAWL